MIGLSRLKRAIADVPTGGMQTGTSKVQLKLCDAQRIEVEYGALIAERDAALAQNAEFEQRINQFIESISQLSNQVVDLQNTRDDLERHNAELVAQVEALRVAIISNCYDDPSTSGKRLMDLANKTPAQHLRDIQAEAVSDFIEFMHKSRDCQLCEKSLNAATQYAERVKAGEK